MKNLSKSLLLFALLISYLQQTTAQDSRQLLSSTTRTFKVHFGIEGGVGASYLLSDFSSNTMYSNNNETSLSSDYSISRAPRPDAQFGIFSEIEVRRWSFKFYLGYLGKTVPKPIETAAGKELRYNLAYLNNLVHNFMVYYSPSNRVRLGLGFEHHTAFIGEKRLVGDNGDYWTGLGTFAGLRAEVGYQINPRMHVNTYAIIGKYAGVSPAAIENVAAGVTVSYRLKGKEYEIKKDIYRINYEAEVLPKAPKGIGH